MTPDELKDAMRDVSMELGTSWTEDVRGKVRILGRADCLFCPVTAVCYVETGEVWEPDDWYWAACALADKADANVHFVYDSKAVEIVHAADNRVERIEESQDCAAYRKAMLEVVNEGGA